MAPDDEFHKNLKELYKKDTFRPAAQQYSYQQQSYRNSQQKEMAHTGRTQPFLTCFDSRYGYGDKFMSGASYPAPRMFTYDQLILSDSYACFGSSFSDAEFKELVRLYFPKQMLALQPYYRATNASQYERIFMKTISANIQEKTFSALQQYCSKAPTIAGLTARIEADQTARQQLNKFNEEFKLIEEFMKNVLEMDALSQKVGRIFPTQACDNSIAVGIIQQNADLPIAK